MGARVSRGCEGGVRGCEGRGGRGAGGCRAGVRAGVRGCEGRRAAHCRAVNLRSYKGVTAEGGGARVCRVVKL